MTTQTVWVTRERTTVEHIRGFVICLGRELEGEPSVDTRWVHRVDIRGPWGRLAAWLWADYFPIRVEAR